MNEPQPRQEINEEQVAVALICTIACVGIAVFAVTIGNAKPEITETSRLMLTRRATHRFRGGRSGPLPAGC
jgi:hypothetical protein